MTGNSTIKKAAKVYHNQYCYRKVSKSKSLTGMTTMKKISRECQKQNYMQKVTIKRIATTDIRQNTVREYSFLKRTAREYHNNRYCQKLPQTKGCISVTIKRGCQNLNNGNEMQQPRELLVPFKRTTR